MPERHIVRTARAMRSLAQRSARHVSKMPERAVILNLSPLRFELTHGSLVLEEEEVVLSQAVRRYDREYGLRVGDTLIVSPVTGGDWVATNVIASATSLGGADTAMVSAGGAHVGGGSLSGATVTVSGPGTYNVDGGTIGGTALVGKVPFRDEDGTILGHIPLI